MANISTGSLINKEYFHKQLLAQLNAGMKEAAEPVIEKALDDIEKEMRKKLGAMVVSFLDGYLEIERMGHGACQDSCHLIVSKPLVT